MIKLTLGRKKLSEKEARQKIEIAVKQKIGVAEEMIIFWTPKIGKVLSTIDHLILHDGGFQKVEEFIRYNVEEIEYWRWKIINDYSRFL